jgi:hypothetical protein
MARLKLFSRADKKAMKQLREDTWPGPVKTPPPVAPESIEVSTLESLSTGKSNWQEKAQARQSFKTSSPNYKEQPEKEVPAIDESVNKICGQTCGCIDNSQCAFAKPIIETQLMQMPKEILSDMRVCGNPKVGLIKSAEQIYEENGCNSKRDIIEAIEEYATYKIKHFQSTHVPIEEANAIKLRNLSLEKQYWLNISNGVKHNNIVIVDTFFAPDQEIEADFFHSKDTNIKRLSSNAVDLFSRLIKQGYTVRFLDDSAKRIVQKLSPPIYDKYYSLIKPQ